MCTYLFILSLIQWRKQKVEKVVREGAEIPNRSSVGWKWFSWRGDFSIRSEHYYRCTSLPTTFSNSHKVFISITLHLGLLIHVSFNSLNMPRNTQCHFCFFVLGRTLDPPPYIAVGFNDTRQCPYFIKSSIRL